VEILEGFRQRTAGQVCVLGHDPAAAGGAWRDRVGVVLQESEPEPGLSVRECLAMYAGFYRAPRDIDQTIALVGLTGKAGALDTRLSGGRRLVVLPTGTLDSLTAPDLVVVPGSDNPMPTTQ